MKVGRPRRHLRETTSTNELRAGAGRRRRAARHAGHHRLPDAPAAAARAARGRRRPAARCCSRWSSAEPDPLLPLRAGLAVADLAGPAALVKWPNDVLVEGRKVAGVLVEARPQEGWAVVGIGVNAAFAPDELPPELRDARDARPEPARARGDAGRAAGHLGRRLAEPAAETLAALRTRDALLDRAVSWPGGQGVGAGIDEDGRLRVRGPGGEQVLDAGEVHLG